MPGLEYVITQLKSVLLSLGMIDRHLSVEQAVLLSRLEEEFQVRSTRDHPVCPTQICSIVCVMLSYQIVSLFFFFF